MNFSRAKLPEQAAERMHACPVEELSPFALMLAPVYIFLRRNQKLVAVKGPLDFFLPDELNRLAPAGDFYIPSCVDSVKPFQDAAKTVRTLLSYQAGERCFAPAALPPAPYELSDAILHVIGPLWGDGLMIEPFFVIAFVDSLCGPMTPDLLRRARERDVAVFEQAVFRSCWAVFLALHLGQCELSFLRDMRRRVFEAVESGGEAGGYGETAELISLAVASLETAKYRLVEGSLFRERTERIARKLGARLERVSREFVRAGVPVPTIYGKTGFIDD